MEARKLYPVCVNPKRRFGFTLIEIAVVIGVVALLAAIAVLRFMNMTDEAEQAKADDMVSRLNSAAALYTMKQARQPSNFTQFVTLSGTPTGDTVLSLETFAPGGDCTLDAATISCPKGTAFKSIGVTYTWSGEETTLNVTP